MSHTAEDGEPIPGLATGRLNEEIRQLQVAAASSPDDTIVQARLGRALMLADQPLQAGIHLRHAARLAPRDWNAQFSLARFLDQTRNHDEALAAYERALDIRPDNVEARWRLGCMQRRCGRLDAAISTLGEVLARAPKHALALHELGLTHWLRGEHAVAQRYICSALEIQPDDVIVRCSLESLGADLAAARIAPDPAAPRVALHISKSFHFPILFPIFERLRETHHARITSEPELLRIFQPDVVVCADLQGRRLRELLPEAKMVYVRHGLTSKNHLRNAGRSCDFLAGITSEHMAAELVQNHGLRRDQIWITGHVPLDPLFRGTYSPTSLPLHRDGKTILFAPTWNRYLSAADLTRERTVELLRGGRPNVNVIIKPHPHTMRLRPDWLKAMRTAVHGQPNVWLVDNPAADIVPLLGIADVLVSDVSSVAFSYLALDRPVVLVTHPRREQDPGFDPGGIEWQWRDLGEEVSNIEMLSEAVSRALSDPARHAARRHHYRELLFGDLTDGRAAERIAGLVDGLKVNSDRKTNAPLARS